MITIPDWIWDQMLDAFADEERDVERVAYLDGVLTGSAGGVETGVVTTLTLPDAELHPGYFAVSPDAMSQAGKHLRASGLCRLAQVHTHPGTWTGHSDWDDRRAYSQWPGAISIVLPFHARLRPRLEDAGVHLRTEHRWQEVPVERIGEYLTVIEAVHDFRRATLPETIQTQISDIKDENGKCLEPPRKRPWWSVLAFWKR